MSEKFAHGNSLGSSDFPMGLRPSGKSDDPRNSLGQTFPNNLYRLSTIDTTLLPQIMFRLIVTEKVRYPRALVGETRELLQQLLAKNPDRRLGKSRSRSRSRKMRAAGGGPGDAEDIMQHAFFSSIDWCDLDKKRITPPFKPEVSRKYRGRDRGKGCRI